MDEVGFIDVSAGRDAKEFIEAHGGDVFAWAGWTGLTKVGFRRPAGVDFVELRADGFRLFQDAGFRSPRSDLGWHLMFHRWPRRRLSLHYGGGGTAPGGLLDALADILSWIRW